MQKRLRYGPARLPSGVALAVCLLGTAAGPACAQTEPAGAVPVDDTEEDTENQEIVITGSRLRRPNLDTPIPVTSIDRAQIEASGVTNAFDLANDIPALGQGTGAQNSFRGSDAIGTSLFNLRNLGANRTLVLVNGRRHVGGIAGSTSVDVGTIPVALLERVEVSTGGASVAYGADAVSGVVNFILRDDFEGLRFDAQSGVSQRGDGSDYLLAATAGRNFAGGRGNATLSLSYNNTGGISAKDREFTRRNTFFGVNPANQTNSDGIPAQILYDDVRFNFTNNRGILLGGLNGQQYTFDRAGNLTSFDPGQSIGGGQSVGGDGYDISNVTQIQNPSERFVAEGRLSFAVSDAVNLFVEAKYARTTASSADQPTGDFYNFQDGDGEYFTVKPDNPYLPDDPRLAALFAANPAIPSAGLTGSSVLLSRFNDDLGLRVTRAKRDLYRIVGGVKGDIPGTGLQYEAYYQYGRTDVQSTGLNNRSSQRFRLAADAARDPSTGQVVCRSQIAGVVTPTPTNPLNAASLAADIAACQPLNLFGYGRSSQAAIDYFRVDGVNRARIQQHVASAQVNGTLFNLPAGDVSAAIGVEWRKEQSAFTPDPQAAAGLTYANRSTAIRGDYEVREAFGELRVPLLSNRPFFETLAIEGGVRISHYSTVGSTTAWRASGEWAPVSDLRFRGGYSVAVRAPNINELFTPGTQGFGTVNDPCDPRLVGQGPNPARRQANCARLVPADFTNPGASITKSIISSGNPDLGVERAKSFTLGAVLRPRLLPGFSATVDYYNIRIDDAISTFGATTIAANCVDQFDAIDNEFCRLVTRRSNGAIQEVRVQTINIAGFETRGIDFDVNYGTGLSRLGLGEGSRLNLRVYGTRLISLNERPSGNPDEVDVDAGEIGTPKWRFNAQARLDVGPVGFSYTLRYVGPGEFDVEDDSVESSDPQGFGAQTYSDVQLTFDVNKRFRAYFGVNNLFDRQPPRGSRQNVSSATILYDQVGRFLYAGVRANF